MRVLNLLGAAFLVLLSPIAIIAGYYCAYIDKIDNCFEPHFYRKEYLSTIKKLWLNNGK